MVSNHSTGHYTRYAGLIRNHAMKQRSIEDLKVLERRRQLLPAINKSQEQGYNHDGRKERRLDPKTREEVLSRLIKEHNDKSLPEHRITKSAAELGLYEVANLTRPRNWGRK